MQALRTHFIFILFWCFITSSLGFSVQSKTYLSNKAFVALAFANSDAGAQGSGTPASVKAQTLWLNKNLQLKAKQILSHRYPKLRIRYWQNAQQTAWILEEIGKEKPITFGVSIIDNQVSQVKVLAFRENRGSEITMQSFSDQFKQIGLTENNGLDRNIDGITGATMSVNAMKKITRFALFLHKSVLSE